MTDRSWFDPNGNKVAECDLNNPAANGECGPWANQNFGKSTSGQTVNPAVLGGWGSRPYDWQFSLGVQQEIIPRVSAQVSYNRRSWGNFYYVDNRAVGPSDYDRVTLTAPTSSKLPDGGGYPYSFYLIKDNKFGQFDNYFTLASDYGDVKNYWHGFDYDMNARMANGFTLQAGATTGHGVRDSCAVVDKLPETTYAVAGGTGINQVAACAVNEVWQTNFRGSATYNIGKIDVLVSAIFRSVANAQPQTDQNAVATNGLSLNGNYDVSSEQVQRAIGTAAARRRGHAVGQSHPPGRTVWTPDQHHRLPVREDPAVRPHPDQRRPGSLQHLQLEHRHQLQPGVRRGRFGLLTSADAPESAVPAVQLDRGLLISPVRPFGPISVCLRAHSLALAAWALFFPVRAALACRSTPPHLHTWARV